MKTFKFLEIKKEIFEKREEIRKEIIKCKSKWRKVETEWVRQEKSNTIRQPNGKKKITNKIKICSRGTL